MTILQRISKLLSANIHHILDQAEYPESEVKHVIREMEASIVELRRETIRAVAREKQLEIRLEASREEAATLAARAKVALEDGNEEGARRAVMDKLRLEQRAEELEEELGHAREVAAQMREDLEQLEDQVQLARQKKSDLLRRQRSAESRARGHRAASTTLAHLDAVERMDADTAVGQAAEATVAAEGVAAAEKDLLVRRMGRQRAPADGVERRAIEAELERLKAEADAEEGENR